MIHTSLRRRMGFLKRAVYFTKHRIPLGAKAFNVIQGRPLAEPVMQMNEYDVVAVLEVFARNQMEDVVVTLESHGPVLTARFSARMPIP